MSLPNFADLGKAARDLLSKNFPGDKSKVEVTTNTDNGATYIVSATRDSKGAVVTLFNPKFKYTDYGLNVNASVGSDDKLKAEVSIENQIAQGVKTTVVAQQKDPKALSPLKATVEYTTTNFTGNVSLDIASSEYYATASVVGGTDGFVAAAEVQAAVTAQTLHSGKGLFGYKERAFETFATVARNADGAVSGNVTYYHNVNSTFQVGGELVAELRAATPKPAPAPVVDGQTPAPAPATPTAPATPAPAPAPVQLSPPKFAFVGQYKLSDDATTKFKADQDGLLTLAHYQQLNKNVKLGLGAALATSDLSSGSHKFGVELLYNF